MSVRDIQGLDVKYFWWRESIIYAQDKIMLANNYQIYEKKMLKTIARDWTLKKVKRKKHQAFAK